MKLTLVKKISEAKGTRSFFWKSEKLISWLPGQFYYYTLPELKFPDARGATRHFTVASSPTEGDLLMLTTRIRQESGFKKTLDQLAIGSVVEGDGPSGTFILDEEEKGKSHVFLAGGIGITPFRVFIKYNIDKKLKIPMHLIYSNSDNDFAFKKELEKWQKEIKEIKIDFIDTSKSGHLDENLLQKLVPNASSLAPIFWVVGPPTFVTAMEETLNKININPDNIRSEKFTGY